MRGPGSTGYYKLSLDSLGKPRIACSRLEAAGRKIAQQFFVHHEIDKAVLDSQTRVKSPRNAPRNALNLPTKGNQLNHLQGIIPYSGNDIQEFVYSGESHALPNATLQDIKRLLMGSSNITKIIAETANKSHLWASDWVKVITKLLSFNKIVQSRSITESLIATGEKLPLGILAAALNIARLKGDRETFEYYASSCPIPRIPIPYPPTQLQLVLSNVRWHRSPPFSGLSTLHLQFFSDNWRHDPNLAELFKALAKGYLKFDDPEMLDSVMWWANDTNNLSSPMAYINLDAARRWNDPQRAWWTWQQVKANGLENSDLSEIAQEFACLRDQIQKNTHAPKLMLIEAFPR